MTSSLSPRGLFINNDWCPSSSARTMPVVNPATEEVIAEVASADKTDLDEDKAIALMLAQPSMIKRPVVDLGGRRLVGFKAEEWAQAF